MTVKRSHKQLKYLLSERIQRGDSLHDIGMSLDVDKSTVSRWVKKYNLKPANKFPGGKL